MCSMENTLSIGGIEQQAKRAERDRERDTSEARGGPLPAGFGSGAEFRQSTARFPEDAPGYTPEAPLPSSRHRLRIAADRLRQIAHDLEIVEEAFPSKLSYQQERALGTFLDNLGAVRI